MANCNIVQELFECLNLANICERFLSRGYEKLEDVLCIEEEEVEKMIENCQDKETFRRRLFEEQQVVSLWLKDLGLSDYQNILFAQGLTTLKKFIDIQENSMEISKITNSVHRKRLLRAVQVLAGSAKSRVLAVGEWDANEQINGKRIGSFLYLISPVFRRFNTERPHSSLISHSIKFLVDSGSDVVTLRPDVIQNLKLDQIGIAKQTGAGGRVIDTRIYSACLEIGGKVIPVEVVADSLDSLGTSVLRHFSHIIHNNKHLWLDKNTSHF